VAQGAAGAGYVLQCRAQYLTNRQWMAFATKKTVSYMRLRIHLAIGHENCAAMVELSRRLIHSGCAQIISTPFFLFLRFLRGTIHTPCGLAATGNDASW